MNTGNFEKPVILVVDDEPIQVEFIRAALNPMGFSLRVASTGQEALRVSRLPPLPSLVLLDLHLPDLDGFHVCRNLKEDIRSREIPVIFLSGSSSEVDERSGLEIGAVDFIHRPASPAIIQARVQVHIQEAHRKQVLEKRISNAVAEISRTRQEIIRRLSIAGEFRDNETGSHVIRVGKYVENLSRAIGLGPEDAALIGEAAQMHDIGKIGIPDRILFKAGIYNEEERRIMQEHCEIGARILQAPEASLIETARKIALHHHEKWDGSGYPRGLRSDVIPLEARITSICDVFDALLSSRPYKKAWPTGKVLRYIGSEAGRSFDPALVPAFLETIPDLIQIRDSFPDDSLLVDLMR